MSYPKTLAALALASVLASACAPIAPSVTKASLSQKAASLPGSTSTPSKDGAGSKETVVPQPFGYTVDYHYVGDKPLLPTKKSLKAEKTTLRLEASQFEEPTEKNGNKWSVEFKVAGDSVQKIEADFQILPLEGELTDELPAREDLETKLTKGVDLSCSSEFKCTLSLTNSETAEWMMKRLSALVVVIAK